MSDQTISRPVPRPTAWSKPYWDAAREGRLVIQHCNQCSTKIMNPKQYCPACLSDDLGWSESSGRGTVYSYSIQKRSAASPFVDRVPYVVAVVRLDEGVQMLTNIVGDSALSVQCGDAVRVAFEPVAGSDITLPVFEKVE
ncbi:MAG: Zn-ribbon domain-containing OB-fold protein [Sphingobium sp.]